MFHKTERQALVHLFFLKKILNQCIQSKVSKLVQTSLKDIYFFFNECPYALLQSLDFSFMFVKEKETRLTFIGHAFITVFAFSKMCPLKL